uniref:Inositol polyphosphate-related phosphatase domain-containing protein n=2 Tax=Denticeps clupeoides TaxID=299321 RepID=A0AAY4ERF6_9TELE
MTCVDDLEADRKLREEVARTLDGALMICGKRASKPKQDRFRLHMVTWNVATAEPPDNVSSLLRLQSPKTTDLYVIGLQEVKAAPLKFVADLAFEDSWSHLFMNTLAPLGYIKVSSIRMQGLLLLFFSRLEHIPFIRDIQVSYTRTGIYGYWGNKGGVSIRLSFYGHMLCFLNCHLAAHMIYAKVRVEEFEHILGVQAYSSQKCPHILDHKVVFWFGDLNFRIADHGMHFVRTCINNEQFHLLWPKDQLIMMKKETSSLQEFQEGPLDFQPTYKFDLNSDSYDSRVQKTWLGYNGKKRKPAWTDRILWRVKPKASPPPDDDDDDDDDSNEEGLQWMKQQALAKEEEDFPLKITQDAYTSHTEYGISDHKPVVGLFQLELKKMHDTPLVRVCAEGEWSSDFDAVVNYTILQPFPSSAWDWIGLYKVGFKSMTDYVTYTWVKDDQVSLSDELVQVYVSKDEIPLLGGDFLLCYYSSNLQCILGISEPFRIQESKAAIEGGLIADNIDGLDQAMSG